MVGDCAAIPVAAARAGFRAARGLQTKKAPLAGVLFLPLCGTYIFTRKMTGMLTLNMLALVTSFETEAPLIATPAQSDAFEAA